MAKPGFLEIDCNKEEITLVVPHKEHPYQDVPLKNEDSIEIYLNPHWIQGVITAQFDPADGSVLSYILQVGPSGGRPSFCGLCDGMVARRVEQEAPTHFAQPDGSFES